jgi:DNA processing protein
MDNKISKLHKDEWPEGLFEIPQKPKEIFIRGNFPDKYSHKFLCIVGSRKHSPYATESIKKLLSGLRNTNIVIVSGLAIGIDTVAHQTALENNLKTIAVVGGGVAKDAVYPSMNRRLSEEIINKGGCIISEYEKIESQPWTFPARNRIMAGLSDAILVVEANEKSGTLITARLALDYNKDLLIVPTTIFSPYGQGSNRLMSEGARAVFESKDILDALGIQTPNSVIPAQAGTQALNLNSKEKLLLSLIRNEIQAFDEILLESKMETSELSQILMEMEIKGLIIKTVGKYESLI